MIFYTRLLKTTDTISHYIENFIDKAPSPEIRQMALQQILQSSEATPDHQKLILLLSGESGHGISCHVSDQKLIEKYFSCIYNIFRDYVKEPDPKIYKEKILTHNLIQSLNTNLDFAFRHLRQNTRSYGSWRGAILSLMGKYFHKKKGFRNLCVQVAQQDESFWARYYAQETLATHYNNDPEILSVMKYCAYHDDFKVNRTHCINLIMTHWPQPETINSMNNNIFHDNETFIRHQIIEALVTHRDIFPNTFEILAECLLKNPNEDTALVAIDGISFYWDDDGKARKALIECILNNKDESILRIACKQISARWPNDPEVKEVVDKHKPEY